MKDRQAVDVLAALAQDTRLAIIRALVKAGTHGMAAGTIAEAVGVSPSNVSFHLATLENAGLLQSRRVQRSIVYVCNFQLIQQLGAFLLQDCCSGSPLGQSRPKA